MRWKAVQMKDLPVHKAEWMARNIREPFSSICYVLLKRAFESSSRPKNCYFFLIPTSAWFEWMVRVIAFQLCIKSQPVSIWEMKCHLAKILILLISCHPVAEMSFISNDSGMHLKTWYVAILLSAENQRSNDKINWSNHTHAVFQENKLVWILLQMLFHLGSY